MKMVFLLVEATLGEIMLTGQIRNSCAESGLDRVFKVNDHHGADIIHFQALEVQEHGGTCFRTIYAYKQNDLFEGKDWLKVFF